MYITVLDEVNISRIEYYFAEFLSLLELPDPKKRELDIVSDSWPNDPKRLRGGKLLLMPENDAYAPIDGSEAEIIGLVKAVVREY